MRIRPLNDRVVVKPLEELSRTAGGIVIPDTAAQKPVRGEYAGNRVKVRGEELIVMREDDVIGMLED